MTDMAIVPGPGAPGYEGETVSAPVPTAPAPTTVPDKPADEPADAK